MIGKKIGKDNIYIHLSAVVALPEHLVDRIAMALGTLAIECAAGRCKFDLANYNFIITHPDYIEFVEAEDFDIVYEPVLGKRHRVDNDGNVTFIERPVKPRVLHQRYKTVEPDYKGFNIDGDKHREKWYRKHFDAKRMAGAGYLHKWEGMIQEIMDIEEKDVKAP